MATFGPSRAARGGQAGREGGGVARWRARAPATLRSLVGKEDDRGGGARWAGPAGGAGPATGKWPRWAAGNVSLPLSVFPILLLFSIFLTFV